MRTHITNPAPILVLFFGLALVPSLAHGASFSINDPETVTITWCDFQGGFTLNGEAQNTCTTAGMTVQENGIISFDGLWRNGSAMEGTFHRRVYFAEGDTGQISDIFDYLITDVNNSNGKFGRFQGNFQSDSDEVGLGPLPTNLGPEDLIVFNESYSFNSPSGTLTGSVNSDPVPEPASLLLIGTGLAGLSAIRGFRCRRRV